MDCAMKRTADCRIYEVAARQSVQTARYTMSSVKYTHSARREDILDEVDRPIEQNVTGPPCNWFQYK
jgi:hypothetical protein